MDLKGEVYMLFVVGFTAGDRNSVSWKLKHNVIEGITELLQDIDNYHSQVAEQAIEHIHQKYVKPSRNLFPTAVSLVVILPCE
jgi:hypothetical protein